MTTLSAEQVQQELRDIVRDKKYLGEGQDKAADEMVARAYTLGHDQGRSEVMDRLPAIIGDAQGQQLLTTVTELERWSSSSDVLGRSFACGFSWFRQCWTCTLYGVERAYTKDDEPNEMAHKWFDGSSAAEAMSKAATWIRIRLEKEERGQAGDTLPPPTAEPTQPNAAPAPFDFEEGGLEP